MSQEVPSSWQPKPVEPSALQRRLVQMCTLWLERAATYITASYRMWSTTAELMRMRSMTWPASQMRSWSRQLLLGQYAMYRPTQQRSRELASFLATVVLLEVRTWEAYRLAQPNASPRQHAPISTSSMALPATYTTARLPTSSTTRE